MLFLAVNTDFQKGEILCVCSFISPGTLAVSLFAGPSRVSGTQHVHHWVISRQVFRFGLLMYACMSAYVTLISLKMVHSLCKQQMHTRYNYM